MTFRTLPAMEDVTIGPFFVVSGVLVVSGAFKVVSPGGVAGAMGVIGRRVPGWIGRVIGAGEMTLGVAAITVGGSVVPATVAVAYLALAMVVLLLRRRGAASCGCFGEIASPPSLTHFGFDLAASALAAGHAISGGNPRLEALGAGAPGGWVVFALFAVLGTAAAVALLTVLPAVLAETAAARSAARSRHDRTHGSGTDIGLPVRTT